MGLPTSYQIPLVLMLMVMGIFHICIGSPLPQTDTDIQDGSQDGIPLTTIDTGLVKVKWHPEPKGRGTVGILVSCTATYIFCIWTSIHPNIMPETTRTCRTFYKMVLAFYSVVIAPGIMVCAMGELYDAYQVLKEWNKKREEWKNAGIIKTLDNSNALGLDGAFFIVMGGFIVQKVETPKRMKDKKGNNKAKTKEAEVENGTQANKHAPAFVVKETPAPAARLSSAAGNPIFSDITRVADTLAPVAEYHGSDIEYIRTRPRSTSVVPPQATTNTSGTTDVYWSTLTPEGFIGYLKSGVITPESFEKRDMDDKGKANVIAKVFAFAQALWMIVQAFARWRDHRHLPLSLLEVHVIIQVVCTSVIYACWWKKPLDVSEPLTMKFMKNSTEHIPDIRFKEELKKQLNLSQEFVKTDAERPPNSDVTVKPPIITTKKPTSDLAAVIIKVIFDLTKHIYSTKNRWYGITAVIVEGFLVMVVGLLHFIVTLGYSSTSDSPCPTDAEAKLWILSCGGMMAFPVLVVFIDLFTRYEKEFFRILWEAPYHLERGINDSGVESTKRHSFIPHILKEIHKVCKNRANSVDSGNPRSSFVRGLLLIWHYFLVSAFVLFIALVFACSLFFTIESYIAMRNPTEILFETPRWVDFWPHI